MPKHNWHFFIDKDSFSFHFRAISAKLSGELEIQKYKNVQTTNQSEKNDSSSKQNAGPSKENHKQTRIFKVQGEFRYTPDYSDDNDSIGGDFHGQVERPESMNNIKFHGKFHGIPEYRESFNNYNHFAKSAPIKAADHSRVNPICVSSAAAASPSSLSEYTDKYKEIDLRTADCRKLSKQMSNVAMRNNLMIGHSDAHVFPEYFESFKDPLVKKRPEKIKPLSPILNLNGSMDYNPEYR